AKTPLLLRVMGRLIRKNALRKPPPAGLKMPKAFRAMFTPPEVTQEEGLAMLREAVGRMKAEPQRHPSPVFGTFTREEWDQFHCRHAELHLSFMGRGGPAARSASAGGDPFDGSASLGIRLCPKGRRAMVREPSIARWPSAIPPGEDGP